MKWKLGEDYNILTREIEDLDDELRHCWTKLTSPRSTFHSIRSQNVGDAVGDGVAKAIDMETELLQKIEKLKALRLQIEEVVETYPAVERRLLRMRYIRGFTWQQIANRMFCDESTCRRLHRQILKTLQN
ncbi:MAG: sigma factor-like helix-turn-helix DNA-binding protein [Clostridiales bacterium]